MLRRILLLVSLAFVVLCYGFPCIILPLGSYEGKMTVGEQTIKYEVEFDFKGKVKIKTSESEEWTEQYYKLKGQTLIISEDKTFNDDDLKVAIENIYEINVPFIGSLKNKLGMYLAIGIGVLDLLLIVTIPNKKD